MKKFKNKEKLIILVFFAGVILRYLRIWGEFWWLDEQLYLEVGMLPVKQIVLVQHWLVDHPQVYILISHFLSSISTNLIWLRMPNLIFFSLGFLYLYKMSYYIFEKKFSYRLALLFFYASHPIFVGIDSQAIPYSLAIALFLATSYYLLTILFVQKYTRREVGWFLLSMVLWAYTSFEFIYWFVAVGMYGLVLFTDEYLRKRVKVVFGAMFVAFLTFLPEVVLVLGRMEDMISLAPGSPANPVLQELGRAVIGYEIGLSDVFWNLILASVFLMMILIVGGSFLKNKGKFKIKNEEMYFWFISVVTLVMITAFNILVYQVGLEKTFYMVNIGVMVVFLEWWRIVKWKMRLGVLVVLISWFIYLFVNLGSGGGWLLASQQRMGSDYNPIELREMITEYANKNEKEVGVYVKEGKYLQNIPLTEYYLKCLDLNLKRCPSFRVYGKNEVVEDINISVLIFKDGKVIVKEY